MKNITIIFIMCPLFILYADYKPSDIRKIFNIMDYGAIGDSITLDTKAINRAIEACSDAGGGTVLFPKGGVFLCGTINLKGSITYFIEKGAVIKAAPSGIMAFENPEENIWYDYQDSQMP